MYVLTVKVSTYNFDLDILSHVQRLEIIVLTNFIYCVKITYTHKDKMSLPCCELFLTFHNHTKNHLSWNMMENYSLSFSSAVCGWTSGTR